jgi:beta-phosphoglucomutase-like phosphatase (HAD superfamily)
MQPITPAPRAVIFDMDGTLADTFPLVVSAWNAAMRKHAGRDFSAEEVIARFGVPDPQMIRRELPEHLGDEAVEVYHAHYQQQHASAGQAVRRDHGNAECRQIARAAHRRDDGKGKRSALITLGALAWEGMFDAVVTGEDVTEQKPQPEGC